MKTDDPADLGPADLNAYREGKRKDKFVRSAVEKAANVRDLFSDALARFHTGSDPDRQIIGFALNDLLMHISPKEIDNLRTLLKKLETARRFD